MTPAEVAALRTVLGLSQEQFAEMLNVNPRTARAWESGKFAPSAGVVEDMWIIKSRHDDIVRNMLSMGRASIPRNGNKDGPKSWWLAAFGRALANDPSISGDFSVPRD